MRPYDTVFNLSPEMMRRLKDACKDLFNPPNGAQLKRMHDEVMADPETQRLIQQMVDAELLTMPCSETKQ